MTEHSKNDMWCILCNKLMKSYPVNWATYSCGCSIRININGSMKAGIHYQNGYIFQPLVTFPPDLPIVKLAIENFIKAHPNFIFRSRENLV